jgi:sodium/potassium/calcium exchanger 6
MMFCFYLLQTTAKLFMTPLLTKVADDLKLPETVAGVTLLAFANGAPDIVTAISAGGRDDGQYISLGSLVGACLFGVCIIIARCIFTSPKVIKINN